MEESVLPSPETTERHLWASMHCAWFLSFHLFLIFVSTIKLICFTL